MLAGSALLPFPSGTASAREERAFDRIESVEIVGLIPVPRLRIRLAPGGIDMRWLTHALVLIRLPGRPAMCGQVSQWRDDFEDFVVTLGFEHGASLVSSASIPREGFVAFVSGSRVRAFPLRAP